MTTPSSVDPKNQGSADTIQLLITIETVQALYETIIKKKHHGRQLSTSGHYEVTPQAKLTALEELEHLLEILKTSELPPGFLSTLRLQAAVWNLDLSRKDQATRRFEEVDISLFSQEVCETNKDRNGPVVETWKWSTLPAAQYDDPEYHCRLCHWHNEIKESLAKGLDHSKRCCPQCGGLNVVRFNELLAQLRWYQRWLILKNIKLRENQIVEAIAQNCGHSFHLRFFGPRFCRRVCFSDEIKEMRSRVYSCHDCRNIFGRKPLGDHETWNGGWTFVTSYPRPKALAWGHCVSCCREVAQNVGDPVSHHYRNIKISMLCESCGYVQGQTRSLGSEIPHGPSRYYNFHGGSFLKAEFWNLADTLKKLPDAALMFFSSKKILKYGLTALLLAMLLTCAATSYYEWLVMRPYQTLIGRLGTVCKLSRTVTRIDLPPYYAVFWTGGSHQERRADLGRFATRLFNDYPDLKIIHVGCTELPWRSREELSAATKEQGRSTAVLNAEKESPFWVECFTRDDPAIRDPN